MQCDTSENILVVLVFLACASGGVVLSPYMLASGAKCFTKRCIKACRASRVMRGAVLAVMAAAFSIFALAVERNRMKVLLDAHTWLSILLATAFACNKLLLTSMKTLFSSSP